ncbi:MAG: nitroreductase family protein, partial [Candidatus Binataceae bacterium]
WAPTGGNAQPWRIVAVEDRARRERLGALYADQWKLFSKGYRANLANLPEPARARMERNLSAADHLGAHMGEAPVIAIICFNPKQMAITDAKLDRVSVVGGASVYPAVENLLLACRAEGLGCVLTTLLCEHEPEVRALLGIPEPWATAAAIPIGYPVGRGHGPITRRLVEELTFLDSWGQPLS